MPGRFEARLPSRAHDQHADDDDRDRDQLRDAQAHRPRNTIVLGAEELDDESLEAGENRPHAEQPSLGVLVVAHAPEDREHDGAERDFDELCRVDGDDVVRIGARRERDVERRAASPATVDGGAPCGNATASGPLYGLP